MLNRPRVHPWNFCHEYKLLLDYYSMISFWNQTPSSTIVAIKVTLLHLRHQSSSQFETTTFFALLTVSYQRRCCQSQGRACALWRPSWASQSHCTKVPACMMSWSMTVAGGVSRSRMQIFNLLLLIKIVAGKYKGMLSPLIRTTQFSVCLVHSQGMCISSQFV